MARPVLTLLALQLTLILVLSNDFDGHPIEIIANFADDCFDHNLTAGRHKRTNDESTHPSANEVDANMTTVAHRSDRTYGPYAIDCAHPLLGQYNCSPPAIDAESQQPVGCQKNNTALVNCTLIPGLVCVGKDNGNFSMPIDCRHTNGYSYETALLLSIFLGMFGADRFYLGYPALGLLKLCTLGFLFLGQLIDIMLIAMQIVGPADGSYYVIKYFGPKLDIVSYNERTDIVYSEANEWYNT